MIIVAMNNSSDTLQYDQLSLYIVDDFAQELKELCTIMTRNIGLQELVASSKVNIVKVKGKMANCLFNPAMRMQKLV